MITKIISGGQTGADQGGLDFALSYNIPHGGECPLGRRCENGKIPPRFKLTESTSASYLPRTLTNVIDSDATLICTLSATLTGGSLKTQQFCISHKKPFLHIHPKLDNIATVVYDFMEFHNPSILNVAGSRESKEIGIYGWTRAILELIGAHVSEIPFDVVSEEQPTIHTF